MVIVRDSLWLDWAKQIEDAASAETKIIILFIKDYFTTNTLTDKGLYHGIEFPLASDMPRVNYHVFDLPPLP